MKRITPIELLVSSKPAVKLGKWKVVKSFQVVNKVLRKMIGKNLFMPILVLLLKVHKAKSMINERIVEQRFNVRVPIFLKKSLHHCRKSDDACYRRTGMLL